MRKLRKPLIVLLPFVMNLSVFTIAPKYLQSVRNSVANSSPAIAEI